jgi:DNA-binding LytR/AlgR family response regulator
VVNLLNIAICDDDKIYLTQIKKKLEKISFLIKDDIFIDEYFSGIKLFENFHKYDILILDIDMPDINGFELAKKIRETNDKIIIIFLTCLAHYVFEAYKILPFRYVMKRKIDEQLPEAILKAYEKLSLKADETFIFRHRGLTYNLELNEIYYFEHKNRQISIKTATKELFYNETINNIEIKLKNYNFERCHSGYVVNLNKINIISLYQIEMKNGDIIPLSRKRYKVFKKIFYDFINRGINYDLVSS